MKIFKFKSLTMRIWAIMSVVILTLTLSLSLLYFFLLGNVYEQKDQEILQVSHEHALEALKNSSEYGEDSILSEKSIRDHHFLVMKNPNGYQVLTKDHSSEDRKRALWMSGFIDAQAGADYHQQFKKNVSGITYIFEISAVKDNLFLVSYLPPVQKEMALRLIVAPIIIILFSLLIAKLVASTIAKPLQELEAYTKRIANKDWSNELEIRSHDEIGRLTQAMNEMQYMLKQADEEEKKFLQSISHDLKTPVMVIMSYAQAIIDGVYVDSVEDTSAIIKSEAERLEKKIQQILFLNTLDYVLSNERDADEVHLDKLLNYLVKNLHVLNPNLEWELRIEARDAIVVGNDEEIRVSIENILENQLRYASKKIQVFLEEDSSDWIIKIYNDGPPIQEKDLSQIFKSFYKGERGNFGLGLAISKKIIDFYKGQLSAENSDHHVCFMIRFPKK